MYNNSFLWIITCAERECKLVHIFAHFAEPELSSYRRPKRVVQDKNKAKNGHENPNYTYNYYDEI